MFFKTLSAMVVADAFDRRRREQQHRRWLEQERETAPAWSPPVIPAKPRANVNPAPGLAWSAPERPR